MNFGGDVTRSITTSGNSMENNAINKKREERFKHMTRKDNDMFDFSSLFGN
jgi:hypothetical protein